jgi:dienelactone hydrolase
MLRRNLIVIAIGLLVSVGAANAQRVTVTVNGGSGGGVYRPHRPIHVWANPAESGFAFDHWDGDIYLLRQPSESHGIINPLKRNVTLTAVYRNAPAWNATQITVNPNGPDSVWAYYFPPNHVGVIFRFHGSGGSWQNFFNSAEDRAFADRAVAAGYAVVAGNSADRVDNQWDYTNPPVSNPDIQNGIAVIARLRQQGIMGANDPLFSLGFSNGGAFASYVAHLGNAAIVGNWRAAALYCSTSGPWSADIVVPHLWNMQRNDTSVDPSNVALGLSVFANLIATGIPAQHNFHYPSPVYPDRFSRIRDLSSADSLAIFNALKQNGFLDGNDYLLQNPRTSPWRAVVGPACMACPAKFSEIEWQLSMSYAQHGFTSDANYRTIQFFNARL